MSPAAYARYPSLAGRAVLVTGGATGIGATLVEQFALQGARVGFIDIDRGAGEALAARLEGAAHAPAFIAADLTDFARLDAAIEAVRTRTGPMRARTASTAAPSRAKSVRSAPT